MLLYSLLFISPYDSMVRYLVYCMFVCNFFVFLPLQISQRQKKIGAWNFACVFHYYPDRSSPILVNFGSRGITVTALLPGCSRNWPAWYEHSELGAAALLKAVWWDLCLASLLAHLWELFFAWLTFKNSFMKWKIDVEKVRSDLDWCWFDDVKMPI